MARRARRPSIDIPGPSVLVVGGSGYVGNLVLPFLSRFDLRVYDRNPPPRRPDWFSPEWAKGEVTDSDALNAAAVGMDLLLYMAMGKAGEQNINDTIAAYDVNVKGLHLALDAAVKAGIRRVVYTSSLSVYDGHLDIRSGASDGEDVVAEPRTVYGFTKLLGEEICRYFHRTHGLAVVILRLFRPVSQEEWHARHTADQPDCRTSAPDVARAINAALALDHTGFEIVHVTGDTSGRAYKHTKARALLDWEPHESKDEG